MNTLRNHLQTLILVPLFFVPCCLGRAQNSNSEQTPVPSPPYIGALSGDFSLVKKFTYPAPDATATAEQKAAQNLPVNLKEFDVVKKGPIRKDTEIHLDGSGREIWRLEAYRFTTDLTHPDSVNLDYVGSSTDSPLLGRYQDASDFPELSWIETAEYAGVQMQQDKKCYTFKSGDQMVWVDVSSRLPVYFQSKAMQVSYVYSDPPGEPLQLPRGFAEKLAKFKRALRGQF